MDWDPYSTMVGGGKRARRAPSPTTSPASTVMSTPSASEAASSEAESTKTSGPSTSIGAPLTTVTALSTTDWRSHYQPIGQFAIQSGSDDVHVYASTRDGIVHFRQALDHPSKPWSEPSSMSYRAKSKVKLDTSTLTGLAYLDQHNNPLSGLYVVAGGVLYILQDHVLYVLQCCGDENLLADSKVNGPPAVAALSPAAAAFCGNSFYHPKNPPTGSFTCVVVPSQSCGLVCTWTYGSALHPWERKESMAIPWAPIKEVASHLGNVSAVSVIIKHTSRPRGLHNFIFAAIIANRRLHVVELELEGYINMNPEGRKSYPRGFPSSNWVGEESRWVQHPGKVTGNPVLLESAVRSVVHGIEQKVAYHMDLLVPSAEGGIFHFVRTEKTNGEWTMIGRIIFPPNVPVASCLSVSRHELPPTHDNPYPIVEFRAYVQCGGRLYMVKTTEGPYPWVGSVMHPIDGPGPFPH